MAYLNLLPGLYREVETNGSLRPNFSISFYSKVCNERTVYNFCSTMQQ